MNDILLEGHPAVVGARTPSVMVVLGTIPEVPAPRLIALANRLEDAARDVAREAQDPFDRGLRRVAESLAMLSIAVRRMAESGPRAHLESLRQAFPEHYEDTPGEPDALAGHRARLDVISFLAVGDMVLDDIATMVLQRDRVERGEYPCRWPQFRRFARSTRERSFSRICQSLADFAKSCDDSTQANEDAMVAKRDNQLESAVEALTPRMHRALLAAYGIARDRGMTWLGTEHVLLALLDDEDGIAGQTLARVGVADVIRSQIEEILKSPGYRRSSQAARDRTT